MSGLEAVCPRGEQDEQRWEVGICGCRGCRRSCLPRGPTPGCGYSVGTPHALTQPLPRSLHRPKYKGRYCVGERKRFRLCNPRACPAGRPSFRHVQCSHFDAMLYKGQLHTWVPVVNDGESCHPRGH